eukprot:CAMPEP_0116868934 /NCGR_PEP_ID=MMETSP0418-20121206/27478_1 /TAXON_ID=1158023 /ORGANISM="Astrosyne radiata, Strain 13vi08-1A" /LENGTH=499 /DNA_ID=CAMNT_0004504971 /DNA_START=59 /DNA_END=1559 /DNA_ORIENTATION=-
MPDLSMLLEPSVEDLSKVSWKPIKSTMTTKRQKCATTVVDNQLLVFGGCDRDLRILMFDGKNNILVSQVLKFTMWKTTPGAHSRTCQPVACCAAVTIGTNVLVIGGFNGNYLNRVEMLDLKTQTWTTLPSMKTKREGCCAGVIDDHVIVVGGHNGSSSQSTAELYDPTTQQWTDLPNMSYRHHYGAMVVVEMKAYIFGGGNRHVEVFDFETRQWNTLPSMSRSLEGIVAVAVGKVILVMGGGSDVVEAFNIESQTWTTLQRMPSARQYCAGGCVGNQVLVVGGYFNTAVSLEAGDVLSASRLPEIPNVLGRQQRKTALQQWVNQVTKIKQEYFAKIETVTFRVNKEYTSKKKALGTDYVTKTKILGEWYKGRMEKLERIPEVWSNDVDDKMEDAKEQIEDLEKRLKGGKPKSIEARQEETKHKRDLLSLLRCPITKSIMVDPVFAADGRTYERKAIEELFAKTPSGKGVKSPVTGDIMKNCTLVPNMAIQAMASEYGKK